MKRISAILLTLCLLLSLSVPGLAAPIKSSGAASTLRLESTEGSVHLKNASGKEVKTTNAARLYNGYKLETEKASYAFVSLDSSKAIKLDASSSSEVFQSGKKLELKVSSGQLFFNVTAPLKSNESLNIRTSTMVTGVRGTSGWISVVDRFTTQISLLEGELTITSTDPQTGLSRSITIVGGQTATIVYHGKDQNHQSEASTEDEAIRTLIEDGTIRDEHIVLTGTGLTVENLQEEDVPGFVAVEVAKDKDLQQKIAQNSPLSVPEIIDDAENRLKEEQLAANAAEQSILKVLDRLTADDVDPLFKAPAAGGGGGGGSNTPPVTPDPPTEEPEVPDTPTETPDIPTEDPDTPTVDPDTPTEDPDTPTVDPDTPTESPDTSTSYSLTVIRVDENGNEIGSRTTVSVVDGDEYDAGEPVDIPNYGYVRVSPDFDPASGTMDSDKTVYHVYSSVTYTLSFLYQSAITDEELKDPDQKILGEGASYTLNPTGIDSYAYVGAMLGGGDGEPTELTETVVEVFNDMTIIYQYIPTTIELTNPNYADVIDAYTSLDGYLSETTRATLNIVGTISYDDAYADTYDTTLTIPAYMDLVFMDEADGNSTGLASELTLDLAATSTLTVKSNSTFHNEGTISGQGTMTVEEGAVLNNNGTITVESTNSLHVYGELTNNYILAVGTDTAPGKLVVEESGTLINNYDLSVGSGSSVTVSGVILTTEQIYSEGSVTVDGGTISANNSDVLLSDALLSIASGSLTVNGGTISSNNLGALLEISGGSLTVKGGTLTNVPADGVPEGGGDAMSMIYVTPNEDKEGNFYPIDIQILENSELTSGYSTCIELNGSNTTLLVDSSTISSANDAGIDSYTGQITVNEGTISGATGISMYAGSLEMTDSTITASYMGIFDATYDDTAIITVTGGSISVTDTYEAYGIYSRNDGSFTNYVYDEATDTELEQTVAGTSITVTGCTISAVIKDAQPDSSPEAYGICNQYSENPITLHVDGTPYDPGELQEGQSRVFPDLTAGEQEIPGISGTTGSICFLSRLPE